MNSIVHFICFFIVFCLFGYVVNLIFFEGTNIFLILESAFILSLLITSILKVVKNMGNEE
ncbi:hypothetical protein HMPREF2910_12170 [Staphylococcus sp. HMSC066C03]|nr:hypothetical protein A4V14_11735 [Staphylococcus capitis]OFQ98440.1 hypothetical protein HMPREF2910_12170 [Staphylococcus sp. HMSC066C03]GGI38715.1 hypothetical protein GCM10008141_23900 [Staphylococcus capitis]